VNFDRGFFFNRNNSNICFQVSVTYVGFVNLTAPATNILLANGTTIPQTGVLSVIQISLNADRNVWVPNVNGEELKVLNLEI
jgi:hypothetical protein